MTHMLDKVADIGLRDWAVPVVLMIAMMCGVTVLVPVTFTYFAEPVAASLSLSSTRVALALSLYMGVLIVMLPVAGALVDRFGTRWVMATAAPLYAGLIALASLGDRDSFPLIFAAAAVPGAGLSPICFARVIVQRFAARRGLALGIMLSGGGLGGIMLPLIVRPVIVASGWRSGLLVLAGLALAAGLSAALIAAPHRTRRASQIDNAASSTATPNASPIPWQTSSFWILGTAFAAAGCALTGLQSQLTALWRATGVDPGTVPLYQSVAGAATITGRLVGGWLMDRITAQAVGAIAGILGALGFLLLGFGAGSLPLMLLAGVGLGMCTGTESDVVSFLSARFYGIARFARTYGLLAAFFLMGSTAGPVMASLAGQRIGFSNAALIGAAVLTVTAVALLMVRAPRAHVR